MAITRRGVDVPHRWTCSRSRASRCYDLSRSISNDASGHAAARCRADGSAEYLNSVPVGDRRYHRPTFVWVALSTMDEAPSHPWYCCAALRPDRFILPLSPARRQRFPWATHGQHRIGPSGPALPFDPRSSAQEPTSERIPGRVVRVSDTDTPVVLVDCSACDLGAIRRVPAAGNVWCRGWFGVSLHSQNDPINIMPRCNTTKTVPAATETTSAVRRAFQAKARARTSFEPGRTGHRAPR